MSPATILQARLLEQASLPAAFPRLALHLVLRPALHLALRLALHPALRLASHLVLRLAPPRPQEQLLPEQRLRGRSPYRVRVQRRLQFPILRDPARQTCR